MIRPLLIALQFLSILPVPVAIATDDNDRARSLCYYPLVGLVLGVLLAGLAWVLSSAPTLLSAALLLLGWVALTGGLHLDGLADSADAWIGGLGNRIRTLEIMKDPYCGPMAVVTLLLVLLIKFTALSQIVSDGAWQVLLVVPVVSRTALVALFLTTSYVRPQGLGSALAAGLPHRTASQVIVVASLAVLAIAGFAAWWVLIIVVGVFLLLRRQMLKRLGGTTGDTAGALVEIIEATALVAFALG